ncbi:unnamed protein product [Caenorhabditis auriculariae]|uniref:Homeobox domain-containing protein n=1 Tax=Caenorhabditis auriculariae TaxID=2777116 RepID=A0A8S1HCS5_9PELO|nr:unnamed protein product [Caenorhabditis auriculariae]
MDDRTRLKYAIVRLPESNVVDFFSLIAGRGYSDVSFVSNLSQVTLRSDPNEFSDSTPSSSLRNDEKQSPEEEAGVSVGPISAETRRPSTAISRSGFPLQAVTPPRILSSRTPSQPATPSIHPPTVLVAPTKEEPLECVDPTESEENITADLLGTTVPNELISNLFSKHGFGLGGDWTPEVSFQNSHNDDNKHHPYRSEQGLQTRMKGWQREYIKEVINNGHYPTEEELRDIERKCDLSRKQVLRFIAKRLVNPNRKPRINHIIEKQKEVEEREERETLNGNHSPV